MVPGSLGLMPVCRILSVLALSSRFDGPFSTSTKPGRLQLSVLALSSRFDGLGQFIFEDQS